MSLFACDICGCVENSALAGLRGWHGREIALKGPEMAEHPEWIDAGLGDGRARCSACNPEVGAWHGHFARVSWSPDARVRNR